MATEPTPEFDLGPLSWVQGEIDQALTEIQSVSRDLADLISRISAQTQMQSTSVTDVTRGMQGILRITEETTEGTKQTNVSIGQLTKLAAELRSSVAGFKV